MPLHEGIELSKAAIENVEECGVEVWDDLDQIRAGRWTRETLLEHCLNGADEDRVAGWHDYVDALFEIVEAK